jgi:hypothetical protein
VGTLVRIVLPAETSLSPTADEGRAAAPALSNA